MKFVNFNTIEEKSCITGEQLAMLLVEESKASSSNKEVYVSLVHNNFDEKGNLMMVITPIDFYDDKMDRHYKYQANFLSQDPEIDGRICGVYSDIDVAKFHVETFYGAENMKEFEKRDKDIAPRLEAIENNRKERKL